MIPSKFSIVDARLSNSQATIFRCAIIMYLKLISAKSCQVNVVVIRNKAEVAFSRISYLSKRTINLTTGVLRDMHESYVSIA